jgi:hypothetical protein
MKIRQLVFIIVLNLFVFCCMAQQNPDSMLAMSGKLSQQYISAVSKKSEKVSGEID